MRTSNCSRDFLSMKGPRKTVYLLILGRIGPGDRRAAASGLGDLARRLVEELVIEGFEPDADLEAVHLSWSVR